MAPIRRCFIILAALAICAASSFADQVTGFSFFGSNSSPYYYTGTINIDTATDTVVSWSIFGMNGTGGVCNPEASNSGCLYVTGGTSSLERYNGGTVGFDGFGGTVPTGLQANFDGLPWSGALIAGEGRLCAQLGCSTLSTITLTATAPEPPTFSLLGLGAAGVLFAKRLW